MKAIVYQKSAQPVKLAYVETEVPVPGDDEVLVRVKAVSLNAADYRSLKMRLIPKKRIFGADIAGVVESVGRNVTLFQPGDEVTGDLASHGFGGMAEFVAAPAVALVRKPKAVPFKNMAAMPLAGMTALQALRDKGGIQKGHKVLIVGCAGGVGTFAIQLARHFGAAVTGVCSSRNVQQALSLGAESVVDYTAEDFRKRGERYDLILGINGSYSLGDYRKALAPGGRYVMVGGSLGQVFSALLLGRFYSFGSKKLLALAAKSRVADLEFLAALMEQGVIRPVLERTYPLSRGAEAFHYLSQGHASGKIVIEMESDSL